MNLNQRESRTAERRDFWRQMVARQEESGLSVRAFCQKHDVDEHTFYMWRKRLREMAEVRFALVETNRVDAVQAAPLEVVLSSGEHVRIGSGVDAATLRTVLEVLRGRS